MTQWIRESDLLMNKMKVELSVTRLASDRLVLHCLELQTMQKAKRRERTLMRRGLPGLLVSTESA
jgi:hypothetical protein